MEGAKNPKKHRNSLGMEVFDVMFVMVLCFLVLLTTMLMRGKVLIGSGDSAGIDYTFSLPIFAMVALVLGGYLIYVISNSNKELKVMIKYVYGDTKNGDIKNGESKQIASGLEE